MTTNATATLRQPAALIGRRRAHPAYERVGKPVLDRTVGLVLLVLAVPLLAVLALVVLLALGRPVLHRQVRVGRHGEHFTLLKLRTMRPDRRAAGDQRSPAVDRRVAHKDDEDPRHTPVGRFLRRWSLDELPQLVHVVTGRMSLVGPRPELPAVAAAHHRPRDLRRLDVRPGLTGLWQVTARGDGRPMHEEVGLDLRYVDELSPTLDLKILLATVPAALGACRGR